MQDRRSYFPLPLREKVLTECLRNAGGMQGCLVSPEPSPLAGEGSDWHMRKSGRKTAERHDDASPPQGTSNRGLGRKDLFLGGGLAGCRHHGVGDEAGIRADRPLDGVADRRVVLEEALGVLAAL